METSTAINNYLVWLRDSRSLSPHTLRAYAGDLRAFARHACTDDALEPAGSEPLSTFVHSQRISGISDRTLVRRVVAVRGFERWLVAEGLAEPDCLGSSHIRLSPERALPRVASNSDLQRMHRYLRTEALRRGNLESSVRERPHHATTLVATSLMLATGLRVAEAAAIVRHDVDLSAESIRVRGKGGRQRVVYVTNVWLADLLTAYMTIRAELHVDHAYLLFDRYGDPISPATIRRRLRDASLAADTARPITPHMLRHAAATQLLEAGVDTRLVQRLLGHASITTTEIYTHVSNVALRSAVKTADTLQHRFLDDN